MLAHHHSTAKFICKKLATRFVSDQPSEALIEKMSKTFLDKDGDIKEVLITMVNTPEFWSKSSVRQKTKSPFELVVSTLRALNADVELPFQTFRQLEKIGRKILFLR